MLGTGLVTQNHRPKHCMSHGLLEDWLVFSNWCNCTSERLKLTCILLALKRRAIGKDIPRHDIKPVWLDLNWCNIYYPFNSIQTITFTD